MKCHHICHILLADTTTLRVAIGIGAMCIAFGLMFTTTTTGEYRLLERFAPLWSWSIAFLVYAIGKFCLAMHWPFGKPLWMVVSTVTLGLFLWFYVYLSLISNGQSAAETMMISLILCEMWIGAQTLTEKLQ